MANKKRVFKGVDLSKWNIVSKGGYDAIKKAGYDFVILRIGGSNGGHYKDKMFDEHYKGAKKAGLKVGCYYDTGKNFIGRFNGIEDARHMLSLMKGYSFEYPVYADVETVATCYRSMATDATIAFCETLEQSNYFTGIYASDISGFKERLELNRLEGRFTLWVARYGKKPEYVKKYDMHQITSTGIVSGIPKNVDIDECYVDFASIIEGKKMNGTGG